MKGISFVVNYITDEQGKEDLQYQIDKETKRFVILVKLFSQTIYSTFRAMKLKIWAANFGLGPRPGRK